MGEVGKSTPNKRKAFPPEIDSIIKRAHKGLIIFSLGTVSNTTNMPSRMLVSPKKIFIPEGLGFMDGMF